MRSEKVPILPHLHGTAAAQGFADDAFCAWACCSAIDNDTTSGRATALNVARNWRRLACEDGPDVFTSFLSWSCRIASSANSSVIAGSNECRMSSATPDRLVGMLHASQAAPAVAFRAKTVSLAQSTMTLEPSGSLFSTKTPGLLRSTCILTPCSPHQQSDVRISLVQFSQCMRNFRFCNKYFCNALFPKPVAVPNYGSSGTIIFQGPYVPT